MTSRLIYDSSNGPASIVVFASGTGTNFEQAVLESRMPGSNFTIDLLVTDKETTGIGAEKRRIGALDLAEKYDIPHITLNGYKECGSWVEAQKTLEGMRDYEKRCDEFNKKLLEVIQWSERINKKHFDLALLAGYMRLFKGPLLRRFNMTAINVHPAALDILNHDGSRRYIGDNAVYDALNDGEERTRSSIILLDPQTDAGAILTSGLWVNYKGERPVTREEANKHQGEQKRKSDWPALRFTLREIALGNFALSTKKFYPDGNPVVLYKGKEMSYGGVILK